MNNFRVFVSAAGPQKRKKEPETTRAVDVPYVIRTNRPQVRDTDAHKPPTPTHAHAPKLAHNLQLFKGQDNRTNTE